MLAPIRHILPLTTVRRERRLPVPGKVVVRKGQKVSAADTLAEANVAPTHLLIDVGRGLRLPPEEAEQHLQVQEGASISEGDLIAGPVGFTRRAIRSPRNGKAVLVGGGQVLIEVQSRPYELKAGIPGVVLDLIPNWGAVVETSGALVQGVWGNGLVDFGLLNVLSKQPDHVLTLDQLDVSLRGSMVLAGHVENGEVLKAAGEMPLRGLVLSSMDPALIPQAQQLPLPLILLEGFGNLPMNASAFTLLSTHERREIALNAATWDMHAGTRPEIVIPLPASGGLPSPREVDLFTVGQQVRVVRAPHWGRIGILQCIHERLVFPSGLSAPGGEVRFEGGEQVELPLANLEVLA